MYSVTLLQGHGEGAQAVLDPNYFSFPGSGLGPALGHGLGNLKTAASATAKSGKLNKGGKGASKAGANKGNLKAGGSGKAVGGRARSSPASHSHTTPPRRPAAPPCAWWPWRDAG